MKPTTDYTLPAVNDDQLPPSVPLFVNLPVRSDAEIERSLDQELAA